LALEKWDVHKQIAETIVHYVGTSKARLLFGFLMATGLLSMWISNTATALMMLPMALAVIKNIDVEKRSRFPLYLLLTIAYGASLGGMATLVGSPPNATMAGLLESNHGIVIDFLTWMKVGLPLSLIMMTIVYFFFWLLLGKERHGKVHGFHAERKKWTGNQKRVIALFLVIVVLWSFRSLITKYTGIGYKDEGAAVLGAILLFVIPSKKGGALLEWKDTRKLPWGILLLFGGGLALAKMLEINGVITEVSHIFQKFSGTSVLIILFVLVAIAIYGTEVMSNLALVNVFVPVVAAFAIDSEFGILQLCMPITLAASCAFMLPISTPPNAIVFSSGHVRVSDMAKVGFVLNLIGVLTVSLFSYVFLG
jgi:sodium-dependent dicarboxylate transporter 2/3/5